MCFLIRFVPKNWSYAMPKYWIRIFCFHILFMCMAMVNMMFGLCGVVHDTSHKCLDEIRHNVSLNMSGKFRKVIRSLPPINIQFGNASFLEKITPVNYHEFATQRTVDFLLLSGWNFIFECYRLPFIFRQYSEQLKFVSWKTGSTK